MASFLPARRSASSTEGLLNKEYPESSAAHDKPEDTYYDPESLEERPLAPGMSKTETMLRWDFIRKVYGIIAAQLLLTCVTVSVILFSPKAQQFSQTNVPFRIVCMLGPLLGLIPLYIYQKKHPANLFILGAWTLMLSVTVGVACSFYPSVVVLEALGLTAAIVVGLTGWTFHAIRQGKDLSVMGPFLFAGLMSLLIWGFIQIFLPISPLTDSVFALLGALLFSGYIAYDTHLMVQRYDLDQYIWAAVGLYLDIINLFLRLLQLLNGGRR